MKNSVVVVGPRPIGADTGVAVGIDSLLDALQRRDVPCILVNSVPGGEPDRAGAMSIGRIVSSLYVVLKGCIALTRVNCFYMTLSTSRGGFLRGAALVLWAACLRRRVVLHLKGGGFKEFYDEQGKFFQSFIRFVMTRANHIIALGRLLVEQFSSVPDYKERVVVIPNGFPANLEIPPGRVKQFDANQSLNILYLSNLVPSKGLLYLMEAVQQLMEDGHPIRLEIAGTLKDVAVGSRQEFDQFVNSFRAYCASLGDSCRYHGTVHGAVKSGLFEKSHLFVLPTFYPWEGQPISIIEALAYGLPVISTPHKGIPEQVIDGYNGFLVQPRSAEEIAGALRKVISEPEQYSVLSANARKHFERNFTREVHQERLVSCIIGHERCL